MRKMLFLMTHVGSRWERLLSFLEKDRNIDRVENCSIHTMNDLHELSSSQHKTNNSQSTWVPIIFHNMQISRSVFNSMRHKSKFLFLVDDLNVSDLTIHGYTEKNAVAYYKFRMNGLIKYLDQVTSSLWLQNPEYDDNLINRIKEFYT